MPGKGSPTSCGSRAWTRSSRSTRTKPRRSTASNRLLKLEQRPQPLGLHPAHRYLGVLAVVHAQLEAALEPRDHFLDPVDVHQERPVYAPEDLRVQVRLQLFDRPVIRFALDRRRYHRYEPVVDGRVNHVLCIDHAVTAAA